MFQVKQVKTREVSNRTYGGVVGWRGDRTMVSSDAIDDDGVVMVLTWETWRVVCWIALKISIFLQK